MPWSWKRGAARQNGGTGGCPREGGTDGRTEDGSRALSAITFARTGGSERARADLTLEGTGSLAIEQNDGTNAEIMSRLDVPFWKGRMKRYVTAPVYPLCMSISPLAQHRGERRVLESVCVSVLPARKQLCLDYIRAPSSWPPSPFASVVCINKNKKPTTTRAAVVGGN